MTGGVEFSNADILVAGMLLTILGGLAAWVLASWKAGIRNAAAITLVEGETKQVCTLLKAFKDEYEKRHQELTRQEERIDKRIEILEKDVKELFARGNG